MPGPRPNVLDRRLRLLRCNRRGVIKRFYDRAVVCVTNLKKLFDVCTVRVDIDTLIKFIVAQREKVSTSLAMSRFVSSVVGLHHCTHAFCIRGTRHPAARISVMILYRAIRFIVTVTAQTKCD